MSFQMYVPTRIIFGAGKLDELQQQKLPGQKALLLTSNGRSAKASGAYDRVIEQLEQMGCAYMPFCRIEANPLKETVEEGGRFAQENGCDFIIALGGGSVIDAAKAIAVAATNPGDLWDYAAGSTGKNMPITHTPLPIIAIPTTAGTGSEADNGGVITKSETHEKIGFGRTEDLFPKISIVDPELMRTVPALFTAYQGFDAFFHATECYLSKRANLMSDMYSLTSIANCAKYLPRAVKDGNDMEAREHMAFASTLSGVDMVLSSTIAKHSLEHALSAYHQQLPHGAGLIMISQAFYAYLIEHRVSSERFVKMAQVMGYPEAEEPEDFLKALAKLQKDCGVDELKMSDYGIRPEEIEELARTARETMGALFKNTPCELDQEACVEILKRSYR